MTLFSKNSGKSTPEERMQAALTKALPEFAVEPGFIVSYTRGTVKGQGTYHVATLKSASRSNFNGLGLTQSKELTEGDFYTIESHPGLHKTFHIGEQALNKAVGLDDPAQKRG